MTDPVNRTKSGLFNEVQRGVAVELATVFADAQHFADALSILNTWWLKYHINLHWISGNLWQLWDTESRERRFPIYPTFAQALQAALDYVQEQSTTHQENT